MTDQPDTTGKVLFSAERFKAFTDAVVAIALTLLILPLMESITELGREDTTTAQWLESERWPLVSFLLSFVLISAFWLLHHRLFTQVERVDSSLQWLTFAWMLSIVWLPVATSVAGQLPADAVQKLVYIGSLTLTVVLLMATRLYLRAHPHLHTISPTEMRDGIAATLANVLMMLLALILAVSFPVLGYWTLFLLFATGPLQVLLAKVLPTR